jgi:hypothetical protein
MDIQVLENTTRDDTAGHDTATAGSMLDGMRFAVASSTPSEKDVLLRLCQLCISQEGYFILSLAYESSPNDSHASLGLAVRMECHY